MDKQKIAEALVKTQPKLLSDLFKDLDQAGISFMQFTFLKHLNTACDRTMSAIAKSMKHPVEMTEKVVKHLENQKYVTRVQNTDPNKVSVRVTADGVRLSARISNTIEIRIRAK